MHFSHVSLPPSEARGWQLVLLKVVVHILRPSGVLFVSTSSFGLMLAHILLFPESRGTYSIGT